MLTFRELKNSSQKFRPAILLDQFMRYRTRLAYRKFFTGTLVAVFIMMILAPYTDSGILAAILPVEWADYLFLNLYKIRGVFTIVFVLWLYGYLYEAFYLTHYLDKARIEYEVARLVFISDPDDLTAGFLKSELGEYVMFRLGIPKKRVKDFLKDEAREKVKQQNLLFSYNARNSLNDDERVINLPDYIKAIYDRDLDLQYFLEKSDLSEDDFFGALKWVQNILYKIKASEKFFSRERLIRIKSIGQNWYVEDLDYIKKYCHLIYENKFYQSLGKDWHFFRDEAEKMEDLLIDQEKENILLVTENISTGMQIVATFGKMITDGICVNMFENKKLFVVNSDIMLVHNKNAEKFEKTFRKVVEQATNTRDIILVLPDLPKLVRIANRLDLDAIEMLKDILDSTELPFIALSKRTDFYSTLETDVEFNSQFDKYEVPNIDQEFLIKVLQDEALRIEKYDDVIITYPALKSISDKYLNTDDAMKKALVELHRIYQS
jgi:ATP-dependent Clp protease ATP-binding subunit ClpA